MQNSWQSSLKIFTPEECAMLAKSFDEHKDYLNENDQPYYKNSYGAFNLPASLPFVERITNSLRAKHPNIRFANTYMRSYTRGSYLKIHTDREGLDLSLSVCIEDKNNLDWPLNISAKKTDGDDLNVNFNSYKDTFLEAHMGVGFGALMKGRTYPHWRDELLCGEKQRALYIFYHWTIEDDSKVVMKIENPNMTLYRDFITPEESKELIELSKGRLGKSHILNEKDGGYLLSEARTSSVAYFQRNEIPLITKIESKIAFLTGTTIEQGEGIQVLRYEIGQEFRPHHDYFPDLGMDYEQKDKGGDRIATALVYLTEPTAGGETYFPDAGIEIKCVQGNMLLFRYDDLSKDTKTLHCGRPVLSGEKWLATKWVRRSSYN